MLFGMLMFIEKYVPSLFQNQSAEISGHAEVCLLFVRKEREKRFGCCHLLRLMRGREEMKRHEMEPSRDWFLVYEAPVGELMLDVRLEEDE